MFPAKQNLQMYSHPTTHPATIITQTSSYRFVTDAEKSTWNAKSNLALGQHLQQLTEEIEEVAYDHSQAAHAPSNAQKNSDITKAEIEGEVDRSNHITYA